jgi:RimJ/RimL family protein N-acetyltransferase
MNINSKKIIKAYKIFGKNIVFRNADVSDAEFILSLRLDAKKSLFISMTSLKIESQIAWLKNYSEADDQAYFIIETIDGTALGTVRIYNAVDDKFCWGSWILSDKAQKSAAIESALIVYSFAIDYLGFKSAHCLNVRKGNHSVRRFHEQCGAELVDENEYDYIYAIKFEQIMAIRDKAKMYLPRNIIVEWDRSDRAS